MDLGAGQNDDNCFLSTQPYPNVKTIIVKMSEEGVDLTPHEKTEKVILPRNPPHSVADRVTERSSKSRNRENTKNHNR